MQEKWDESHKHYVEKYAWTKNNAFYVICCRYSIMNRNFMSNFVSNQDSKHRYFGFILRNFMRLLRTLYCSFQNKIK